MRINTRLLLKAVGYGVSTLALVAAVPAAAQDQPPVADTQAAEDEGEQIVVTAQRPAPLLQDVPISVSAFSGEQLQAQQIENAQDLQLSVPNVTFTKTNFT